MARYNGKDAARECVLEVTKLAATAAYKAPQLTARLDLKTEIVTDEDQEPIMELFAEISPISSLMATDYTALNHFRENGEPLTFLLLGADLSRSELGWDCGACGFETCSDFNQYAKKNFSKGVYWSGPSCAWKMMDFAAACDFACAAAHQYRMETRAMATLGIAAASVGFLPECSFHIGIPVGPPGDLLYFSRRQNIKEITPELHRERFLRSSTTHWLTFPGSAKPSLKTRQDWWADPEFVKWEPLSAEEKEFVQNTMVKVGGVAAKHVPAVSGWYKKEAESGS